MLKTLGEHMAGTVDNIGETLEHLSKELEERRFLLVLDDVWNEDVDKWDGLKNCSLKFSGSNGSDVLVTARSGHAAYIKLYNLQTLRHIECTSVEIYCLKLLTCCLKTSSAHVLFLSLLE